MDSLGFLHKCSRQQLQIGQFGREIGMVKWRHSPYDYSEVPNEETCAVYFDLFYLLFPLHLINIMC